MPSTTDTLDEARELVQKRLAELDEEKARLERALTELGGKATRRRGRPKGSTTGGSKPGRRRRRGGTRAEQAVKLIEQNPDITASEIAKTMKIKPNYMYRVLSDLESQKRVKKSGRKYRAA
jgi:sugar-specific transcriptional regulator TrmB